METEELDLRFMIQDSRIKVAGVKADPISKSVLLDTLLVRLRNKQKTFLVTLYSEFLRFALRDPRKKDLLNRSDIAVADGIAIPMADFFLSLPLNTRSRLLRFIVSVIQLAYSLTLIVFAPGKLRKVFPEKIVGADLFWDLGKLCSENNFSMYLLGSYGDIAKIASQNLKEKYPNVNIAGYSNAPHDHVDTQNIHADVILVAFGPIKQEQWIVEHKDAVDATLFVGVGGTFDYAAGHVSQPPLYFRQTGLEWFWRFITQPNLKRIKRVLQATFGLMYELVKFKVNSF